MNSSATIQVTIGKHKLGVVEALVADTADYDLILGYSELRRLKPTIHWDTGQLEFEGQGQEGDKEGMGKAWKQLPGAARTGGINMRPAEPARVMGLLPNSMKGAVMHELEEFAKETGLSLNSVKLIEASPSGEKPKHPTIHGKEFVLVECLIRAALEDGPIGFMLLDIPPSSLLAFGFVPTGADRGVEMEMEVEVDKKVLAEDIPEPYQPL